MTTFQDAITRAEPLHLQVLPARLNNAAKGRFLQAWCVASQSTPNLYHVVIYDRYALSWTCDCASRVPCVHKGAAYLSMCRQARRNGITALEEHDLVAAAALPVRVKAGPRLWR
jgi:hypothetical protein